MFSIFFTLFYRPTLSRNKTRCPIIFKTQTVNLYKIIFVHLKFIFSQQNKKNANIEFRIKIIVKNLKHSAFSIQSFWLKFSIVILHTAVIFICCFSIVICNIIFPQLLYDLISTKVYMHEWNIFESFLYNQL